jgi:hypothetical protein
MIDGSGVRGYVMCGICPELGQLWQFNMVTHLENCSRLEVRGILCFCVGIESGLLSESVILLHDNA